MSDYQLISFDMDGTLLNSKKELTPGVIASIQRAVDAGKAVCLSTGRSVAELRSFKTRIPGLRYVNCCSGAMVYDFLEGKAKFRSTMEIAYTQTLMELARLEDAALQIISTECIIEKGFHDNLANYHMDQYKEHFDESATDWENIPEQYKANPFPIEKLNLYHRSLESMKRTEERFLAMNLPLVMVHSEETGLEFSPANVDKGVGLRELSQLVEIPLSKIIAVGDAENDLAALTIAGLGIAMGNANEVAKAKADLVVADCDHDGAAEAIDRYLLP